jgi:heme/copper-type cytochrome/quinol oxidase subunit 4
MTNSFLGAIGTATQAAFGRAPTTDDTPTSVSWTHAVTGIVLLAILQVLLLVVPFAGALPEALRAVVDFALLALVMTAVPFVVVGAAGLLLGKQGQLPTFFLFLALVLALSQLVGTILGAFGISAGTAMIGILGYFVARAAKSLFGMGWGSAILLGLLAAVASFAASFIFLMLPTGQAMLAAP